MDPNKLTPGRKQRAARGYIPYNADPRNIGTLTGRPMPQNVRLDPSTEFENVSEFFQSPPQGTSYGASSRRTVASVSGAGGPSTRRTGVGAGSSRSLAALGAGDDDDEEEEDGEGVGRRSGRSNGLRDFGIEEDEDDVDVFGAGEEDMLIDSPSLSRNTTTNSRSSRRPQHNRNAHNRPAPSISPRVQIGSQLSRGLSRDLSSPVRGSGSPGGGKGSPGNRGFGGTAGTSTNANANKAKNAGARLNKILRDPDEDEDDEDGFRDDFEDAMDVPNLVDGHAEEEQGENTGSQDMDLDLSQDPDQEQDLSQDPDETIERPRLTRPSQRKSLQARSKRAGGAGDDTLDIGMEEDVPMMDDAGGDDFEMALDDGDGDDVARPMVEDEDEEDLDQDGSDEEEADSTIRPIAAKKNANAGAKGQAKAKPTAKEKAQKGKAKQTHVDDDDDGSGWDGGGRRTVKKVRRGGTVDPDTSVHIPVIESGTRLRGARERHAPLAYWKGERAIVIKPETFDDGWAIKEWVTKPTPAAESFGVKGKKGAAARRSASAAAGGSKLKGRGRSASAAAGGGEDDEEDVTGWDEGTESSGLVREYIDGVEEGVDKMRRVACPERDFAAVSTAPTTTFRYQKVFGEDEFFAAGVLYIDVDGAKSPKESKDNVYVFIVLQGCVEVTIHRTRFLMSERGMFLVPRGNLYGFKNKCKKEVKMYFAQARKNKAGDAAEGSQLVLADPEGTAVTETVAALTKDGQEQEEEDEEEDDADETPVKKTRKKKATVVVKKSGGAAKQSLLKKATTNAGKKTVGRK